jgi:fumarylacetoacetase
MHLRSAKMRQQRTAAMRLSTANFRDSYWTLSQIVAHQTSNGCNLQPGDLLGSGTLSGTTPDSLGSLMELSQGGKDPIALPFDEVRTFAEDGDEIIERGAARSNNYKRVGFGEASGTVQPARG